MEDKGKCGKRIKKYTEYDLKELILKLSIDEYGNKVSIAKIMENDEFQKLTGWSAKTKGTYYNIVIKKMKLTESVIFSILKDRGIISTLIEEEEWCKNKNKKCITGIDGIDNKNKKESDIWQKLCNNLGFKEDISGYKIEEIKAVLVLMGYNTDFINKEYEKCKIRR